MGVSKNGGSPIAGWFLRENPTKMDDEWGYPHDYGNPLYPWDRKMMIYAAMLALGCTIQNPTAGQEPWIKIGSSGF